jgi:hypothetical protein
MSEQCRFRETNRTGLYIMVFIAMIAGCEGLDRIKKVENQVKTLEQSVELLRKELQKPQLKEEGGLKFYEINGQGAYTEINGIPITPSYTNNNEFESKANCKNQLKKLLERFINC